MQSAKKLPASVRQLPALVAMAFLLSGLILGLWNAGASPWLGWSPIIVGPQLVGVVMPVAPTPISWKTIVDGSAQESATRAASEALAWRPALIRVNNEIAFSAFRQTTLGVLIGHEDVLYETGYVTEYCSRNLAQFEPLARAWVEKLRRMQTLLESNGQQFIYVITPSKAAIYPEYFAGLVPCPAPRDQREGLLPLYRSLLETARINYLDAASMVAQQRRETAANDLFPRGGTHWSMYATAPVAREILTRISARFPKRNIPSLRWTAEKGSWAWGSDADLAWMLNLLVPRLRYPVYHVDFSTEPRAGAGACDSIPIAAVGGSFFHLLDQALTSSNCATVYYLYYFRMGLYAPHNSVIEAVRPEHYSVLATSPVIMLEENEMIAGHSNHGPLLYNWVEAALGANTRSPAKDSPDSIFCAGLCEHSPRPVSGTGDPIFCDGLGGRLPDNTD
jgi:alginate O-acetyltransferase complex protein AlgJ